MNEIEKFDFSDIFPDEKSEFVRFDDVKNIISQPQFTIPKSIADLADKEVMADPHTKFKIFIERYELSRLDNYLQLYCCDEDGREKVFAYLNPRTRDLVKVVDDDR